MNHHTTLVDYDCSSSTSWGTCPGLDEDEGTGRAVVKAMTWLNLLLKLYTENPPNSKAGSHRKRDLEQATMDQSRAS